MKYEFVEGINPKMLRWARENNGLSISDVSSRLRCKIKEIEEWESGKAAPNYIQLEKLAYKIYKRPLASFFLSILPAEESPKREFRTLPEFHMDSLLPDTYGQIRLAHFFQISLSEIFEKVNPAKNPIWKSLNLSTGESIVEQAQNIREFLGIDMQIQMKWPDEENALKGWRQAIEDVGIFVFKNSFKQKEISGFCLRDENFPLIYINNSTTKTRQIFSLLHELSHILFRKNGISKFNINYIEELNEQEKISERLCNSIASEILVPKADFLYQISGLKKNAENWQDEYYEKIAKRYKVSREVILRKLLDEGYIEQAFYERKANYWSGQIKSKSGTGGNYYLTQRIYLSNRFSREVLSKYYNNKISIEQAAEMFNVKVKSFGGLEQEILKGDAG